MGSCFPVWLYRTSGEAKHQLVLYEYQPDRKHIHPKNILKDFKGYLLFANTPNGAKTSAIYYSLIVTARENGLNPFEYLTWIFTNAPNLGKPGYYATAIEDLMPNSEALPKKLFSPKPKKEKKEIFPWEEG